MQGVGHDCSHSVAIYIGLGMYVWEGTLNSLVDITWKGTACMYWPVVLPHLYTCGTNILYIYLWNVEYKIFSTACDFQSILYMMVW